MARKHHRSLSRKSKRATRRRVTRRRSMRRRVTHKRSMRKRGGSGAPVDYSLAGSWSSKMSLGQGTDFFKYHAGQHGGEAPYPGAVADSSLPASLRGPAHLSGLDKAFTDISGLKDQAGGRRRKSSKRRHSKKHRSTKRRHTRRRRGGALGYAPVSAPGMLLGNAQAYTQAGLNPAWKSDPAFAAAKMRDTQ
jgi:hypothetical protein